MDRLTPYRENSGDLPTLSWEFETMIIEHHHKGDPYSSDGLWHYLDANLEFVATVVWREFVRRNDGFNGPSCQKQMTKIISAESDSQKELEQWARNHLANGADSGSIYRTWIIPESQAPKGHRLHGKRENGRIWPCPLSA